MATIISPPDRPRPDALADDLACALDPARFARRAGLAPDPWQADVLRSHHDRVLLNCSRQSGKSTVAALIALHAAIYRATALVLLLSPTLRQSQELFRKVLGTYAALGRPLPPTAETKLTLELDNGSRIVSLPGTERTVRGFSGVALLVIDEAARVPDDLYRSVRPMLATTNGRLIALSTPFGRRGWWSDAWHSGEDWLRVEVPASQCPRIPAPFLEEERRTLGAWWYQQEYECQFLDAESQAFRTDDIDAAFAAEVDPWSL